jgi:hypothetical protein
VHFYSALLSWPTTSSAWYRRVQPNLNVLTDAAGGEIQRLARLWYEGAIGRQVGQLSDPTSGCGLGLATGGARPRAVSYNGSTVPDSLIGSGARPPGAVSYNVFRQFDSLDRQRRAIIHARGDRPASTLLGRLPCRSTPCPNSSRTSALLERRLLCA